jgi:16S rRNA (guanine(966)-N(2))-methyltransferase RsmD
MSSGQRIRIIGGSAKGRTVHSAPTDRVRPTPAGLREALANMLRGQLAGKRVLDLYAGFGTVGLELLSQGAEVVVFVERDRRTADVLRRNVDELDFGEAAEVWTATAEGALERLARDGYGFDIIFADPPYNTGAAPRILEKIADHDLLDGPGLVLVQHSSHEPLPAAEGGLRRARERRSGDTVLSWYEPVPTPAEAAR